MVGLKSWNKPSREELIEMRGSGVSWATIAEGCGVHPDTIVRHAKSLRLPGEVFAYKRYAGSASEVRRLIEEFGYDDQDIAGHFGITEDAAAMRRRRAGILIGKPAPNNRKKTPEQLAEIEAMLDDGMSFTAIRQVTGADWATLNRHFPGRQYTKEQSREAASLGQRARHLYNRLERAA